MAKTKPSPLKPRSKEVISSFDVFKHYNAGHGAGSSKTTRKSTRTAQQAIPQTRVVKPPKETFTKQARLHFAESKRGQKANSRHFLMKAFSGSLDDKRQDIHTKVADTLQSAQYDINARLSETITTFGSKLKISTLNQNSLVRPMDGEKMELKHKVDGQDVSRTVFFGGRMREFQDILSKEEKELEKLWQAWIEVQESIVCLGVEVLGPKVFDELGNAHTKTLSEKLRRAISEWNQQRTMEAQVQSDITGQEEKVEGLSSEMTKESKAMEQKFKLEKKKRNAKLQQLQYPEV